MAVTTFEKNVHKALSIDEKFLRRLAELVQTHGVNASFSASLSDQSSVDQLTVDELMQLPNSKHRAILTIELTPDYRAPLKVRMTLRGAFGETNCAYQVVGNEKDATYVSSEIDRLIKDATRPFSYFSAMPPLHVGMWWMALNVIPAVVIGLKFLLNIENGIYISMMLFTAVACGILQIFYGRIIGGISPPIVFMTGDGFERSAIIRKRGSFLLSFLFIVIAMGIVVSVSSNWLYDKFVKAS